MGRRACLPFSLRHRQVAGVTLLELILAVGFSVIIAVLALSLYRLLDTAMARSGTERVRHRAREGWITVEKAKETYGVVLDTGPELFEVDYEATKALRAEMRRQRG